MRKYLTLCILIQFQLIVHSQCNIDFGTLGTAGTTIVANGGTQTAVFSYDIWNELTGSCTSAGGANDVTITYETINTFDAYGGFAASTTNGTNYNIQYQSTGLRGTLPHGNIPATQSSPGDVRCYKITVDFADHVNDIIASEFQVNVTSVNTTGTAFESMGLVFLDRNGNPYGSVSYNGYYNMNPGPSHPGIVTSCPNVPPNPTINSNPWSVTGPGAYVAAGTSTVNISTNSCTPASGTTSGIDNTDILASSTGLSGTAGIGGFVYQVCLENVGTFTSDIANANVSTTFTSTLNGVNITGQAILPVDILSFDVTKRKSDVSVSFTTASETNNDYFTIERSGDGVAYEAIGQIKGAGNSSREISYEYTDEAPLRGVNYYRIKQTDFDGKYSYSEVRSVRFTDGASVTVSPRTTAGRIDITTDMEDYTVEVYTASGAQVQKHAAMNADQTIDIQDLKAGIYFLRVSSGTHSETVRVVKL